MKKENMCSHSGFELCLMNNFLAERLQKSSKNTQIDSQIKCLQGVILTCSVQHKYSCVLKEVGDVELIDKQNCIHLHCEAVQTEMSKQEHLKPELNPKLTPQLDTTKQDNTCS